MSVPKLNNTIDVTRSLCPLCLKVLPALIHEQDNQVYMSKTCPEHGEFNVYLWPDAEHYRWFRGFTFPTTPRQPQTRVRVCRRLRPRKAF